MSETHPLIFGKISAIMDEMEAVPKANTMTQGAAYKYRSIDQVKNASNPLFAKHKVFYTPKVIEKSVEQVTTRNGAKMLHYQIKVLYSIFAEDGSKIECEVYGEAMDSGDKGLGKAQTYAEKVMLIQVLNIPLEDQPDPDHQKPVLEDAKKTASKPAQKPAAATKTQTQAPNPNLVSEAQIGRLYTIANNVGWTNEEVKNFLVAKGYKSSKEILKKDYAALVDEIEHPKPAEPLPQSADDEIPF